MANEHNLKPFTSDQSREEAVKNGRKGGIASGEARRARRTMKDGVEVLLDKKAPDRVIQKFQKAGYDVETNYEATVASIVAGAITGKPEVVRIMLDLIDENPKAKREAELFEYKKRKEEAEASRAEMETEFYRMRLNAIKGIGDKEMPDDGFLEALKGTAGEDWSDEVL